MICHFLNNLIAVTYDLYKHFYLPDTGIEMNLDGYQKLLLEHWQLNLLLIAISAPYLIYFFYKNLPSSNDITKLPYFVSKVNKPLSE